MARFTLPRDLYHGKGSLEMLKTLGGKKAIIVVGGGTMKKMGFLDKAISYLKEGGMEVELFEGVEPDPSVETVMRGAEAMRKFEPDWIVSMGGGSPIDAAKAMWAFYEYPETTFEQLITPFSFPTLRTKAKFCAIPSTSGTATEVTAFAVITDYNKGIKYPLADYNITPDDSCSRSIRFHSQLQLHRSACTPCNQNDKELPRSFLQRRYERTQRYARCTVPCRYGVYQRTSRYRSLYGT